MSAPSTSSPPAIVTGRLGYPDSHTFERFLATGGYEGLRKALRLHPEDVAAEVSASNLLGRGGAGFETGRKWSLLPAGKPVRYLVVNGDESEPATFKDHMLIERDPHQLLEGIVIAAYAIGAAKAYVYIRAEYPLAIERLIEAIAQAEALNLVTSDEFYEESDVLIYDPKKGTVQLA